MAAPFRNSLHRLKGSTYLKSLLSQSSSEVPSCHFLKSYQPLRQIHSARYSRIIKHSLRFSAVVGGATAVCGIGLWGYSTNFGKKSFSLHAESELEVPYFKPARQVSFDTDGTGLKLTLFQYQTCPFCCKVRAVLDYHGVSYDVIEVNSVTKKQLKWSEYPKVPILVVKMPGSNKQVIIKDSSVIISVLESYLNDKSTSLEKYLTYYPCITETVSGKKKYDFPNRYFIMYQEQADIPKSPKERNEERKWRQWADDHMVHMLSPNVYRSPREALQAFRYFDEVGEWEKNFSFLERKVVIYAGATVMFVLGKILKKRYNLKDDVRESLYDACNEWTRLVGKSRSFHGGNEPDLADLAVYGVLNSIEGCLAFEDVLKHTRVGPWYRRTKEAVYTHQGAHPLNSKAAPSDKPKQAQKK